MKTQFDFSLITAIEDIQKEVNNAYLKEKEARRAKDLAVLEMNKAPKVFYDGQGLVEDDELPPIAKREATRLAMKAFDEAMSSYINIKPLAKKKIAKLMETAKAWALQELREQGIYHEGISPERALKDGIEGGYFSPEVTATFHKWIVDEVRVTPLEEIIMVCLCWFSQFKRNSGGGFSPQFKLKDAARRYWERFPEFAPPPPDPVAPLPMAISEIPALGPKKVKTPAKTDGTGSTSR